MGTGVGRLGRAGEDERTVVLRFVCHNDHGVASHGEGALEVAEGGVGGVVVLELRHLVLLRAVGGVEGEGDCLDAVVVGHRDDIFGADFFLGESEVVDVDFYFGVADFGGLLFAAAGEQERCYRNRSG